MITLLLEMKATKEEMQARGDTGASQAAIDFYSTMYNEIMENALSLNPLPEKDPNQKGKLKRGKTRCLIDRLVT